MRFVVHLLLLFLVVADRLGVTESLAGAGTTGTARVSAGGTVGGGIPTASPPTPSHVLSYKKVVVVGGTVVFEE